MEKSELIFKSPVGMIRLRSEGKKLQALEFVDELKANKRKSNDFLLKVQRELEEYFVGKRKKFTVKLEGEGTEFQKNVWQGLKQIPYGQTISYQDLAQSIQNEKAVRAVGSANGKNPFPILVPCHRVIQKNGSLGGFTGGLWRKKKLLEIEGMSL